MSGPGAWGFLGGTRRLMELPDTDDGERAPLARARLRYSRSSGLLEESRSGSAYAPLGSDTAAVDDIAELQDLPDESLPDGYPVGMASLLDLWYLRKGGTETPDGITIVDAASGTAQWERACLPHQHWAEQADWYINASTGDDENDGSDGNQLKTWAEWQRRTAGSYPTAVDVAVFPGPTVYIETDLTEDTFAVRTMEGMYSTIEGVPRQIHTGTITAATDWNSGASTEGTITDAGLSGASWADSGPGGSSLVGKMIRLTSGAGAGAFSWIANDNGAKVARLPRFFEPVTHTEVFPAGGETYEVVDLPVLHGLLRNEAQNLYFYLKYIDIRAPADFPVFISHNTLRLLGCRAEGFESIRFLSATEFVSYSSFLDVSIYMMGGEMHLHSGVLTGKLGMWSPSHISIFGSCVFQPSSATAVISATSGCITVESWHDSFLAAYDQAAATAPIIRVCNGGCCRIKGKVFGTGNAGYGTRIEAGSTMLYPAGANFTTHYDVQGLLVAEVRVGGVNTTYAAIGLAGTITAANNAMVVPTE